MKIRWSIGFKIFSLAAFLVLAIFAVALISFNRTAAVNNESKEITEYYLPLTQIISRIDEHVLRQELHFSRILRKFSADLVDLGLVKPDIEDLKAEKQKVESEISLAIGLVEEGLQRSDLDIERDELEAVKPRALQILKEHQNLFDRNLKILDALNNHDFESARTLIALNREKKDDYNASVDDLMRHLQSLTLNSSKQADLHEAFVLRFNFLTTLIATILAVVLAFLITRGLVRPIHRLVRGARKVETGNLDTEVSATSKDEIGDLTLSFNHMVSGLRLKERIKETFGKYIDPRIVERLIQQSDGGKFKGEKRVMTVLFSDLKEFTSISEGWNPTNLVQFVNLYLSEMSKPIAKHGGGDRQVYWRRDNGFLGPAFYRRRRSCSTGVSGRVGKNN